VTSITTETRTEFFERAATSRIYSLVSFRDEQAEFHCSLGVGLAHQRKRSLESLCGRACKTKQESRAG
jgi:hypothetical protein